MQDEWKKLKAAIAAVGTLVLMGAGLLAVTLTEHTLSDSGTSGRRPASFIPWTEEATTLGAEGGFAPEGLKEIILDCDIQALELPKSATHVRFKIPTCPKLQVLMVRNETNQIEGTLFYQDNGTAVSELIGLKPGENQFTIMVKSRKDSRAPASAKVLRIMRRIPVKESAKFQSYNWIKQQSA